MLESLDPLKATLSADRHSRQERLCRDRFLRSVPNEAEELINQVQLVCSVLPQFLLQGIEYKFSSLGNVQTTFQFRDLTRNKINFFANTHVTASKLGPDFKA